MYNKAALRGGSVLLRDVMNLAKDYRASEQKDSSGWQWLLLSPHRHLRAGEEMKGLCNFHCHNIPSWPHYPAPGSSHILVFVQTSFEKTPLTVKEGLAAF